ncbi:MAG TPA: P-loop NTPase fold protein [Tabrizicola sp.]|nr:P-loop NTPase fold protein [Tabrizicola sp.]
MLDFAAYGSTFTNLIQSIDDTKVISIEAGFGHGKTFFRKAWAEHLRQVGEVVIEIDAQQSDHSGEPIITFLGALMAAVPVKDLSKVATLAAKGGKLAGVVSRAVTRAVLRNGAEEVIEAASGWRSGKVEGNETLEGAVKELEEGMSRLAGEMIARQLAAEHARVEELPKQVEALRDALTERHKANRVVILIDELDRCHPDYAIALLEAMKLVFGRPGFVFCLMVNADRLENIAHHRFGTKDAGEKYLEKFVDLRLRLRAKEEALKSATQGLAMKLPLAIPFGEGEPFSVKAAAELAGDFAADGRLSFRQIKRILDKVELALRCYGNRPIDCPLLVYLAFEEVVVTGTPHKLARAQLTPDMAESVLSSVKRTGSIRDEDTLRYACEKFVNDTCPELMGLSDDRYQLPPPGPNRYWPDYAKVLKGLGPRYIPEHEAMLAAVYELMASAG